MSTYELRISLNCQLILMIILNFLNFVTRKNNLMKIFSLNRRPRLINGKSKRNSMKCKC